MRKEPNQSREADHIQEAYERNVAALEEEADDEELWDGHGMQTMYTSDVDRDLLLSPFSMRSSSNDRDPNLKRKVWLETANGNISKFETGESSGISKEKRLRESLEEESGLAMDADKESEEAPNMVRGEVGPEPPLPP